MARKATNLAPIHQGRRFYESKNLKLGSREGRKSRQAVIDSQSSIFGAFNPAATKGARPR